MHMDITPYVESLRRDLVAAAEAAGPEAREATERLAVALAPAPPPPPVGGGAPGTRAAPAEPAGPEAREATERLAFALDPAARLALMEAVSQAAAEITAEMPNGGVDVRLNGRELDFVVQGTSAAPSEPASGPASSPADEVEDDGSVARI